MTDRCEYGQELVDQAKGKTDGLSNPEYMIHSRMCNECREREAAEHKKRMALLNYGKMEEAERLAFEARWGVKLEAA